MNGELKYQDLLYFGYDWSEDGEENRKAEQVFIREIKEQFPHVVLRDAYDDIKGYRQEVLLHEEEDEEYKVWLIGKGWFKCSFTMQLMMMSGEIRQTEKINNYIKLAKAKYPEAFKPETNETEV